MAHSINARSVEFFKVLGFADESSNFLLTSGNSNFSLGFEHDDCKLFFGIKVANNFFYVFGFDNLAFLNCEFLNLFRGLILCKEFLKFLGLVFKAHVHFALIKGLKWIFFLFTINAEALISYRPPHSLKDLLSIPLFDEFVFQAGGALLSDLVEGIFKVLLFCFGEHLADSLFLLVSGINLLLNFTNLVTNRPLCCSRFAWKLWFKEFVLNYLNMFLFLDCSWFFNYHSIVDALSINFNHFLNRLNQIDLFGNNDGFVGCFAFNLNAFLNRIYLFKGLNYWRHQRSSLGFFDFDVVEED